MPQTVVVISVNGRFGEMCGNDQENISLQFTAAPVVLACPGPEFVIIIILIMRDCVCFIKL